MDWRTYLIIGFMIPGLPGGMITSWLSYKLRQKPLATGGMEEFVGLSLLALTYD